MSGSDLKSAKIPGAKEISCPSCSSKIRLFTYAQAINIGCGACGKLFLVTGDSLKQLFVFKVKAYSLIQLGSKVRIKGILFAVVGYAQYREYKTIYSWNEYVLFNPAFGYAFLSECEGHWNIIFLVHDYPPKINTQTFEFNSREYRVFHRYKSSLIYAAGEFHWDVNSSDKPNITEFVSPPYILSKESTAKTSSWYLGEYLKPSEVKEIFSLQKEMPNRYGVGPNQIFPGGDNYKIIKKVTIFALFFFLAIQLFFVFSAKEEILFTNDYWLENPSPAPIVSPSFNINGGAFNTSDLECIIAAPVSNSWFEAAITLVNETSGEEYYFEQGVEYYFGYTGGEHWSEGGTKNDKLLSSIPSGKYHLNISPHRDFINSVSSFNIKLVRDVPIWTNFWLLILISLIYPIYLYFRVKGFEYSRWINSDFSPYGHE